MPCSRRKVEGALVFCPYLLGCVRENAAICKVCAWNDRAREDELYYKFMKHIEEVRANLAREEPSSIDEFWWEARVNPLEIERALRREAVEKAPVKPKKKPVKERKVKPGLTIEYHLKRLTDDLREVVLKLREEIMRLDEDVEENVNKTFIGYRSSKTRYYFANVKTLPLKREIEIRFRSEGPIEDSEGLSKPIPKSFDTSMDRRVRIKSLDQIPYVIDLLRQAYRNMAGAT